MKNVILVVFAILLFFSCKSTMRNKKDCTQSYFISDSDFENSEAIPFAIKSISISNDCLIIPIQYSGGCQEPEFSLYINKAVKESFPPQRDILLVPKNEDQCERLIQETLKFDLSILKNKKGQKIKLNLVNTDLSIIY